MPEQTATGDRTPTISVVIPAHNEQGTIAALLTALTDGAEPGAVSVVVACNGCTDATADIARGFGPDVMVLDLPEPSKRAAQVAADVVARGYPRAYVDADVALSYPDLTALARAVGDAQVLAAAPERSLDASGASWVVRRYYRVWERLPQVREGLFGRGVVVVSQAGGARLADMPQVMSDDLVMSEAFGPQERVVVRDTHVRIRLPRTVRDLVKRRIRVATGNTQADQMGLRQASSSTSVSTLVGLVTEAPTSLPDVTVFLTVTVVARLAARRRVRAGDFTTWLRDDSSRAIPTA